MSKHPIVQGKVPLLQGHSADPAIGNLRVGPAQEFITKTPDSEFHGEYKWMNVLVDYSEIDYSLENWRRMGLYGRGEYPIKFAGSLLLGREGITVEGLHYRSGFYIGQIELPDIRDVLSAALSDPNDEL